MNHYYTDEINTLVLVSLLKAHGIKKVIASPGTTNISFVGSIQFDPYFEIYSAVDERAAAFMACGLAEEADEPVVLTCTGATASRNYIPGLTEAYYRHLPVLAVTSTQHGGRIGNYVAQIIDRSEQFSDMVKKSYQISAVYCEEDKQYTVTAINDAILELYHGEAGPVHINLFTTYSNNFVIKELPRFRVIYRVINQDFPKIPKGNIGIFVGAHEKFTAEETAAIDGFCKTNNAVVICDQISNYRGKYRFLANFVNSQERDLGTRYFDLIIYIGYVHGAYLNFYGKEAWRVNRDGVIRDPYRNLTYVFEMEEQDFFEHYTDESENNTIIKTCYDTEQKLREKIPELPFSNMWIAKETAQYIPENSVLHLSILNTLRIWNYFETPSSVLCYSNSGGYGIDGCVSSFIGSAITNQDIEHFMIVGDLSFFYDLDTLFNEIPPNVHFMLINNGVGTEFKNYNHRAAYFGADADKFMAAKGHNGFKNPDVVKSLCDNLKIRYFSATSKEEFAALKDNWLAKSNAPVLMEVFTTDKNESDALKLMNSIESDTSMKSKFKRSTVGRIIKKIIRGS
ncbi:thiamine pyrophosphate-binding protein [Lacrimispora sp. JR3]|uniref:thiamine pyrophosphate-binding protein n=1 Tax=Lacrimispora sinapis TaxID=3111456 RepID=UPI0037499AD3